VVNEPLYADHLNIYHYPGFYLLYSGLNYWIHRAKHGPLWRLHEFHHAPQHMGAELCVWRHPVETFGNLGVLLGLGQLLQVPVEVAASALLIEGLLEIRSPQQRPYPAPAALARRPDPAPGNAPDPPLDGGAPP